MKRENRKNILFRYGSIVALILLLSMRIVYKLADNTVMSADKWNAKAAATLSSIDTILPVRGNILAADGSGACHQHARLHTHDRFPGAEIRRKIL